MRIRERGNTIPGPCSPSTKARTSPASTTWPRLRALRAISRRKRRQSREAPNAIVPWWHVQELMGISRQGVGWVRYIDVQTTEVMSLQCLREPAYPRAIVSQAGMADITFSQETVIVRPLRHLDDNSVSGDLPNIEYGHHPGGATRGGSGGQIFHVSVESGRGTRGVDLQERCLPEQEVSKLLPDLPEPGDRDGACVSHEGTDGSSKKKVPSCGAKRSIVGRSFSVTRWAGTYRAT